MAELDEDGLPVAEVGEWAAEKHERLHKYVDITRPTRRKYTHPSQERPVVAGAAYIDLFCGSGRARIKDTATVIDGSPLVACKAAGDVPFSQMHVADLNPEFSAAAEHRLRKIGGNAFGYSGSAEATAREIVEKISPHGLHFAFLDPFKLESLTWRTIEILSALKHIDLLLHVSVLDLQRNFDLYSTKENSALDAFAPGWRAEVSLQQSKPALRAAYMEFWRRKTQDLGFTFRGAELVTGSQSQRLYWLIFLSRHRLANDFWDKIRHISGQGNFGF